MNALTLMLIRSSLFSKAQKRLRFDYVIMVLGIVISVAVVATAINLFEGYEKTLKKILLSSSAHILVYSHYGQTLTPVEVQFAADKILTKQAVKSIEPVYTNTAMVRLENKIRSCLVRAYPHPENSEIWYEQYISEGSGDLSGRTIILGDILAKDLALEAGDTVTLLYPQTDNLTLIGLIPHHMDFTISAVVKTGYYEMDKTLILMSELDAFDFYRIPPQYTHLEINLQDKWINKADRIADEYQSELGDDYKLYSWIDFNGNLFSLIVIEKWLIFLVFSFLILIAALNCISIVSTSILDKKREIAILKAVGVAVRQIKQVVYLRILTICIISIVIGLVLGSFASWLITQQSFYQLKGDVYFIDQIKMHISVFNYLAVFIVALILIALCIKLPLKYVNRMNIIDVLRGI